ncbi:MAG: hypothetical protein NTY86_00230 [Deltaproteobacteria bacterium]|nr:hypothetical protein [Deltaproteobacteria bacterium]
MKRGIFFWVLAVFFIVGCAAPPPAIEKKDVAAPAVKPVEETPAAPPRLFEERDLLLDGVALLSLPERPDPEKARSIFLSLIQRYPQSRWRPAAEAFIRLIDEKEAFEEMSRQDRLLVDNTRTEWSRALQENDHLKKTVRELTEKLQSETAALAQENEQLKRDIQRLKALEIELQKRERMLR